MFPITFIVIILDATTYLGARHTNVKKERTERSMIPVEYMLRSSPAVHGTMGCRKKTISLVCQLMIPGAVHRSPGIYFAAEENPDNLS